MNNGQFLHKSAARIFMVGDLFVKGILNIHELTLLEQTCFFASVNVGCDSARVGAGP
jgi:hypothetical protein